jgi:hypothetical protein
MYGFPTQTAQETIDSLEMVRQLFKAGVMKSAYWHQFAMTAHSPVGLDPEKFGVKKATEIEISFADNDIEHIDESGTTHDLFSDGLKKSLFNFMQEIGLDEPLYKWFDMKVPKTIINKDHIINILSEEELPKQKPDTKVVFIGTKPSIEFITKSKKGNQWELAQLTFETRKNTITIKVDKDQGTWLHYLIPLLSVNNYRIMTLQEIKDNYNNAGLEDFELFWDNKPINQLYKAGLLQL